MLRVRGYAAVFGNVDTYNTVFDRGSFSDWLRANAETTIQLFYNHSHRWDPTAKPIGKTTKIRQDRTGLYFEGEILDTAEGLEVQELLRGGALRAASFAFSVQDKYQKKEVWHLKAVSLKEITAATFGANPRAYIEPFPDQGEPDDSINE